MFTALVPFFVFVIVGMALAPFLLDRTPPADPGEAQERLVTADDIAAAGISAPRRRRT
ncbi:hypothetical protein H7J88_06705 [Mycolicibacterium flavescens]|uniref:hypothetical protein n=1 Tax=Mycolicibacterium flavescens TaxID=1776 RepID=UPI0013F4E402|nr:hypothetical protein [Mycolicibacterium flavescens]MCV7279334.1 hypothetical protein [Mycolicibacterium flavescens]